MAIISKTGYHFTYGQRGKKPANVKGPAKVSKTGYRFTYGDDKPVQLPEAPQKSSGKAGGGKASGGKLPDIPTNTSLIAELMQEEAERKRARTEHISPFLKLGDGSSPYISDLAEAAQKVYGNKSVPIRKTSGAYKGYRVYERDTGGEIDSEQAERMKARLRAEMGLGKTADQLRKRAQVLLQKDVLTDEERQEAKSIAKNLKAGFGDIVRGEIGKEELLKNNNIIAALESRTSGLKAGALGALGAIPIAGNQLEKEAENARSAFKSITGIDLPMNPVAQARADHPTAYDIGAVASDAGQLIAMGGAVSGATKGVKGFTKLAPWAQRAINSALTFGTSGALDTAGAGGDFSDIAKSFAVRGAAGAAGSGAQSLTGAAGEKLLFALGLQNRIAPEIIRQGIMGAAFSGGNTAANYALDKEYRPSGEQVQRDLLTAFAFSAITSGLQTVRMTQQNRTRLESAVEQTQREYAKMFDPNMTQAQKLEALDRVSRYNGDIRAAIGQNRYVGQQAYVNQILAGLDAVDDSIAAIRGGLGTPGAGDATSTAGVVPYAAPYAGATVQQTAPVVPSGPGIGQGILPVPPKQQSGAPQQIFPVGPGQNDLPASTNHEAAAVDTSPHIPRAVSRDEAANMDITDPDNLERYRREIDGAFSGSTPQGQDIILGRTPDILQQYGATDRPLHMGQATARKIAYPEGYAIGGKDMGGKHNLGMSVLKQLPQQLKDPAAILNNPQANQFGLKSIVVLTQWKDSAGRPVIVPVHIDAQGAVDLQNNVASAFQAKQEYLSNLLGNNGQNVLYTKNNEDIHQLLSSGQTAPEAMADDVFINYSIHQAEQKSNRPQQVFPVGPGLTRSGTNGYDGSITENGGNGYGETAEIRDRVGRLGDGAQDTQGQAADGRGTVRGVSDAEQKSRMPAEDYRQVRADSEGRRVSPETAERLRGTAIADEAGAPLAVYHYTPDETFTVFSKGDTGFHFGNREQAAQRQKDKGTSGGRTIRAYLNIRNPIRIPVDIMSWKAQGTATKLWSMDILTEEELVEITALAEQGQNYDSPASVLLREMLDSKGYDGIAYANGFEGQGTSYIAFYPEQVITAEAPPAVNGGKPAQAPERGEDTRIYPKPPQGDKSTNRLDIVMGRDADIREHPEVRAMLDDDTLPVADTSGLSFEIAEALTGNGVADTKDYARNFDAAGKNSKEARAWLRETIEKPFEAAKAEYARWVKNQLAELKNKTDELGIRPQSRESAAVQWLGEKQRLGADGEMHPYSLEQLKVDFPDSWQNIVQMERYCRGVYDGYVDRVNATLEQIYPNALEKAQDELEKKQALAEGFRQKEQNQRQQMGLLAAAVAEKKNRLTQMRQGTQARATAENSLIDMERRLNDMKGRVQSLAEKASMYETVVRQMSEDIQNGEVLRNKRLQKRGDYFHHFAEQGNSLGDMVQKIMSTPSEIDPRLEGLSDFTQPKGKWAGFMQRRKGGAYTADAVGGMLKYIPAAEYKIHMDPVIARNRGIIRGLAEATKDTRNANRLILWLTDWTNDLAGKTNFYDRWATRAGGRKLLNGLRAVNSGSKANAVLGNMRSMVAQFFNLPNGAAYVKNPADWKNGLRQGMKRLVGDKAARDLMAQSGFLNERYLDKSIAQFETGVRKVPRKLATWMMSIGDELSTRLIWSSAYSQAVRQGEQNPIRYADDIARRAVAGRGIGEVPLWYQSQTEQLIAPFQIEVNNTYQLLKERVGAKDAAGLLTFAVASAILNGIARELLGFDVSFDPIGMMYEAVKQVIDDWGEEEDKAGLIMDAVGRAAGEVVSNLPMGAQAAQLVISDDTQREKFFGDSDPTRFGTGNIGVNMVVEPIMDMVNGDDFSGSLSSAMLNTLLPYGGKQVERGIGAAQDMGWLPRVSVSLKDGISTKKQPAPGSYSESGRLRFPINTKNPLNIAADFAFGPFSTGGGREYLAEGRLPLSDKNTGVYESVVGAGADSQKAYDLIQQLIEIGREQQKRREAGQTENLPSGWANAEKRQAILESELTPEQKQLFDGLYLDGKERSRVDYTSQDRMQASSQPASQRFHAERAVEAGIPYADYERYIKALRKLETDKKDGKAVSGSKKRKQMAYINMQNLTRSQKLVLADAVGLRDDMAVELGVIPKAQ